MSKCYKPIRIYKNLDRNIYPEGIEVNCGKCLNCLENKAKEKAMRIIHEKEEYNQVDFITLTLDDKKMSKEHKTKDNRTTVNKSFIRKYRDKIYSRLYRWGRKSGKKYTDYKYMIGAEYGENGTERAHYHIILLTKKHRSKILHQWLTNWKEGNIKLIENAGIKSIYYTAGYTAKKIGTKAKYEECQNPFLIASKGLGKNWAIKHNREILNNHCIYMSGDKEAYPMKVPKYYIDKLRDLGLWTEEEYENYVIEGKKAQQEREEKDIKEAIGEWYFKATGTIFRKCHHIPEVLKINYKGEEMIDFYEKKTGIWRNNLFEKWKKRIYYNRKMIAIEKFKRKAEKRGKLNQIGQEGITEAINSGIIMPSF